MNYAPILEVRVESSRFNSMMLRYAEATGKSMANVVRQNARLIAWNLAHNTQPYGMTLAEKKTGEAAVASDIGEVFKSATVIFGLLKLEDEKLARAWYQSVKNGNYSLAEDLLRKTKLRDRNAYIGAIEPSFHQRNRNSRGRVERLRVAQIVPDAKSIKTYIREKQQLVGFGKAGWISAGNMIGKVTRVPSWITRHAGIAPGHAVDNTKGIDPHVTLSNDVRYISAILLPSEVSSALRIQREKMEAHIKHVLAAEAAKNGLHYTGDHGTPLPSAA